MRLEVGKATDKEKKPLLCQNVDIKGTKTSHKECKIIKNGKLPRSLKANQREPFKPNAFKHSLSLKTKADF